MASRISYDTQGYVLSITIKRRKGASEWYTVVFLAVWLVGWAFGIRSAIGQIIKGEAVAFLLFWLTLWLLGGVIAAYQWMWTSFGAEVIQVGNGLLSTKKAALGIRWGKSFPAAEVSNLRCTMKSDDSSGGTVAFDYQGETHRFGIDLTEPEAQEVVDRLKPYLPHAF